MIGVAEEHELRQEEKNSTSEQEQHPLLEHSQTFPFDLDKAFPVYEADEDSFLLLDALKKELGLYMASSGKTIATIRFLEMGAGSGYIGFSMALEGLKDITLADVNPEAIVYLNSEAEKSAVSANILHSDLFSEFTKPKSIKEKFDIIIFNTPYLPNDEGVFDPALHGGSRGNEIAIRFLNQAKDFLADDGFILLLTSSLSHPEEVEDFAEQKGYTYDEIASKHLFFEELIIYKFVKQ